MARNKIQNAPMRPMNSYRKDPEANNLVAAFEGTIQKRRNGVFEEKAYLKIIEFTSKTISWTKLEVADCAIAHHSYSADCYTAKRSC